MFRVKMCNKVRRNYMECAWNGEIMATMTTLFSGLNQFSTHQSHETEFSSCSHFSRTKHCSTRLSSMLSLSLCVCRLDRALCVRRDIAFGMRSKLIVIEVICCGVDEWEKKMNFSQLNAMLLWHMKTR